MIVTIWFMIISGVMLLLQFIDNAISGPGSIIYMNAPVNFSRFFFHTIFTAPFAPDSIWSLLFAEIMLYSLGKNIELQFGPKFMAALYAIAGGFGVVAMIIFQYGELFIFGITRVGGLSAQWCAILGLFTFILYLVGLNREIRFYLYFIPIKLKAKYVLIFLIGQAVITGLLGAFIWPSLFNPISSIAQLAGILAGKLMYNKYGNQFSSSLY